MKWLVTTGIETQLDNYLSWLSKAGIEGVPVFPSDSAPELSSMAALFLPGGGDVDPSRYNTVPAPETAGVDPARDEMECRLIEQFVCAGRPVFGVCRGIQILNVTLGGKLIQHVPSVTRGDELHRRADGGDSTHPVLWAERSRLAAALVGVSCVNSNHHQAVDPQAVGRGLRIVAVSGQGVIEALEGVDLNAPALAVQWHPERMEDAAAMGLLNLMKQMAV